MYIYCMYMYILYVYVYIYIDKIVYQRVNRQDIILSTDWYTNATMQHPFTRIAFDEDANVNCRSWLRISKIQLRYDPSSRMQGLRN